MPIVVSFFIGLCGGIVAALAGVGGGVIMVPAFVLASGLSQKQAVATSLAVIIPTALAATARNFKSGLIDWKIVIPCAVGAVIAAWVATAWMQSMQQETLRRLFGVLLLVVAVKMLWPGK